ncbi:hypothetical protein FSP39_015721 [Pinctada imbricata]|uniref:Uncharacterized protein n=1 Tax=Pinctada imbricata TaxID=66713 RepID=A0AA88Y1E3_PINIB|nr:hypothetical protein FSP39_015721 [Pinctada imbricata]
MIETHSEGYNIIGGDWNDTLQKTDRKTKRSKIVINSNLRKLKNENKLVDPWLVMNKNNQQYTWRRKHNPNEASRIDFFLIHSDLQPKIKKADIRPVPIQYTDHQAVSLFIDIQIVKRGPGYWKLNNNLLKDTEYQNIIENLIEKYTDKMNVLDSNIQLLWEKLKIEIKENSIRYGILKAKNRKNKIQKLEEKLKENLKTLNPNDELIKQTEKELEKEYEFKTKGAQIRSRIKWLEEGEKNTRYFLSLEKQRQIKKSITKLKDKNGIETTDQDKILEIEKEFYQELYISKNPNKEEIDKFINETKVDTKLSDSQSNLLEGPIQEDECQKANYYPDDYDSAEDFEDAVTLLSPNKKSDNKSKKKETPRNRSHSAPPTRGGRTGHDLWMNAVKNRQTLGLSGNRRPESPRHKTPTEYWVDTLRRTGIGISTESTSMNSLSAMRKNNDMNMAYLSTSSYLRQMAGTEKPRKYENPATKPPTGTPAYKSPEEYYDQVLELKKQIKSMTQEISSLRAKVRRTEEDNIKKEKEIGGLLDPTKNEEMRRALGDKNPDSGAVIQSLKQKILKLENQIRDKESAFAKLQSDMKTTKVEEMKVQLEMCYQEIVRLQNSRETGLDKSVRSGKESGAKVKALNQTIIRLNKQNEELQTEIRSLKEDLNREIDSKDRGLSREYEDMNRKQLLGAIKELERKLEKVSRAGGDNLSITSLDKAEKRQIVKGKLDLTGSVQDRLDQLDRRETELLEEVEKQRKLVKQLKEEKLTNREKMKEYEKLINEQQSEIDYLNERGGTGRRTSRAQTSPRTQTPKATTPRTPSGRRSSRPPSARRTSVDSTASEQRQRRLQEEEEVERFRKEHAAKRLQRGWKSHRKEQQEARERQELAERHREVTAARKIQRSWKSHQKHKEEEYEKAMIEKADQFRQNKAATKIQKAWKAKSERENELKSQKEKEIEEQEQKAKEEEAAMNAKVEDFRQNRAARKIQKEWTGYRYRKHEGELDDATELIQASLKGHQARSKNMKRYMSDFDDYDDDDDDDSYNEAVDLIQSSVKGHYNRRKKVKSFRDSDDDDVHIQGTGNVFSASTLSGRPRPGSVCVSKVYTINIIKITMSNMTQIALMEDIADLQKGTSYFDRPSSRGGSRRLNDSYDDDDDIEGF